MQTEDWALRLLSAGTVDLLHPSLVPAWQSLAANKSTLIQSRIDCIAVAIAIWLRRVRKPTQIWGFSHYHGTKLAD